MITFKESKSLKEYDSVSLAHILREHFVSVYPVAYTDKLNDAIQVASYLHRTDVRRGSRGKMPNPPYIEHPLRVAVRMFQSFKVEDPELLLAAVLHDTVEDHAHDFADFEGVFRTPIASGESEARERALQFISKHFGYRTASYVDWVSNPVLRTGATKEEKLSAYHKHVENIAENSPSSLLLKFSDFVDNAGSLHHHYSYDDPKARYYVERYSPLIPIYEMVFEWPHPGYDGDAALARLHDIQKQFQRFQKSA